MINFLIYFLLAADFSRESFAETLNATNGTTIEISVNRTSLSNQFLKLTTVSSVKQSNDSTDIDVVPEHKSIGVTHNSTANAKNESTSKSNTELQNGTLTIPKTVNITSNSSLNTKEHPFNGTSLRVANESEAAERRNQSSDIQRDLKMGALLNNTSKKGPITIFVPSKVNDSFEDVRVDLIAHNEPSGPRSGLKSDATPENTPPTKEPIKQQSGDELVGQTVLDVDSMGKGGTQKQESREQPNIAKSISDGSLQVDIDLVPVWGKTGESGDVRPDVKPRMPVVGESKAALDVEIDLVDPDSKSRKEATGEQFSQIQGKKIGDLNVEFQRRTTVNSETNENKKVQLSDEKPKVEEKPPVIQLDVDIVDTKANGSSSSNGSNVLTNLQKEGVISLDIDLVETGNSGVNLSFKVQGTPKPHLDTQISKLPMGSKEHEKKVLQGERDLTLEKSGTDVDIDVIEEPSNPSFGALNIPMVKGGHQDPSLVEVNLDVIAKEGKGKLNTMAKEIATSKPDLRVIPKTSAEIPKKEAKLSNADAFIDVDIDLIPVADGNESQLLKGHKLPKQWKVGKGGGTGTIEVQLDVVAGKPEEAPKKSGPVDIDVDLVPGKGNKDSKVKVSKQGRTGQTKKVDDKVAVDVDLISHRKIGVDREVVDFQKQLGSKDPYVEVDIDFVGDKKVHLNKGDQSGPGLVIGPKNVDTAVDVDIEFVGTDKKLKLGPPVSGEAVIVTESSTFGKPMVTQGSPNLRAMAVPQSVPADGPFIEVDIEFVANNNSLLKTLKTYKGPNGEEIVELPPGFKIQESAVEVDIDFVGNNLTGIIEPQPINFGNSNKAAGRSSEPVKPWKPANGTQFLNVSLPLSSSAVKTEGAVEVDIDFVTNKKLFNISGLIGGAPVFELPPNLKGVPNPEVEVDVDFVGDKLKGSIAKEEEAALYPSVKSEEEAMGNELNGVSGVISDSKKLEGTGVDSAEQPKIEDISGRQIMVQSRNNYTDTGTGEEVITKEESTAAETEEADEDVDSEEERTAPSVVYTAKPKRRKGKAKIKTRTTKTVNKFPIPPHMKPSLPAAGRMKDSGGSDDSKASSKGGVSIWVWGTIVAVVAMSLMVIAALSYSPIRQKTMGSATTT